MAVFTSLYSGSDKNSSVIEYKTTKILVDCGGSFKSLKEQLSNLSYEFKDISSVVITHNHVDHISALKMIIKNTNLKIYGSLGTHEAIFDSGIDMDVSRRVVIHPNTCFSIGDIDVEPFKIPHDTTLPLGFNFFCGSKTASYATDIGHIPEDFSSIIKGRDFVFLESNHDVELLKKCNRPITTINRILGKRGHLSNNDSAKFSSYLAKDGLKRLMLGHLSGDANTPDIAYETTIEHFRNENLVVDNDITLDIAQRGILSKTIHF